VQKSFLVMGLMWVSSVCATEFIKLPDYLKTELAGSDSMSQEVFTLNDAQKKDLQKLAPDATDSTFKFFYAKDKSKQIKKACTVGPQAGKEGPMTVGVCFNMAGLITSVTILSHVEDHGRGIEEASYLNQFKDKPASSSFQLGKDVVVKSGATRSSKAVSEAVRKASYAFRTFVQKK
jgi:Na+-translocating ferredoxin:NAD+ oxidoreductase RnfG subunit